MTTHDNPSRDVTVEAYPSTAGEPSPISTHRVPGKPWVHEMVLAHRLYREELATLPPLVGATRDRERATLLRKHYDLIAFDLHHHHTFEDENFWPVIAERDPLNATVAHRMAQQHEQVAALLETLPSRWADWQRELNLAYQSVLVKDLTLLAQRLAEHLADEEQHMLPIMERVLSEQEWKAFGDYLFKVMGMRRMLRTGGIVANHTTKEELDEMVIGYPAAKIWLIRYVGIPMTRRYLRKVRGSAAPI